MTGCIGDKNLDDTHFSQPLPWIGLYIAGASLLCGLAMGADAYRGFSKLKVWFPPKYFGLNSLTLTLLGIATKLPVDLNTSMPRSWDQLTKLSGTVLICTLMANFMPSLGTMSDSDSLSNVIALAILVITVIVNMIIQMCTGVIYVFLPEHVTIIFIMLLLLVLLVSSALIVPTTKEILDDQFNERYEQILTKQEIYTDRSDKYSNENLREYISKFWLMSHTSSPQFVIWPSPMSMASGTLCLASTLIFTEAIVRRFLVMKSTFCDGESDYRWSIVVVLLAQAFAVVVGTIPPAVRWVFAIKFKSPELLSSTCEDVFKVEKYWIERLEVWKEDPYAQYIDGPRWVRRFVHKSKDVGIVVLMAIQKGVVMASKVIWMISIVPISWVVQRIHSMKKSKPTEIISNTKFLRDYVLHLEGENDLVTLILKSGRKDTNKWIDKGKKNQPAALIELITNHSSIAEGFAGVCEFDYTITDSSSEDYNVPHCWALPIVTLASIAVALPGINKNSTESLLKSVNEGLKYVRVVETYLDDKGLINMREAADMICVGVDLYHEWNGVSLLHCYTEDRDDGRSIVERLYKEAEECVSKYLARKEEIKKIPLQWPRDVLAADCMRRISKTILRTYENDITSEMLFGMIRKKIADILGACLTNLPRCIYMMCFSSPTEEGGKDVRHAALLLGEAEELLTMLSNREVACFYPENKEHVEDWVRLFVIIEDGPDPTQTHEEIRLDP